MRGRNAVMLFQASFWWFQISNPHLTSCSRPRGADIPSFSADPSAPERSGPSLHIISRAMWGMLPRRACAQPARPLPRSQRGRETKPLHQHRWQRKVEQNPSLTLPRSSTAHIPTPHTGTDTLVCWRTPLYPREPNSNGFVMGFFPWPCDHVGPGLSFRLDHKLRTQDMRQRLEGSLW